LRIAPISSDSAPGKSPAGTSVMGYYVAESHSTHARAEVTTMRFSVITAALFGLISLNSAVAGQDITVSDAWVREGPPGAPVLGGFMVIHNQSKHDKTLVKASASGFQGVSLHQTIEHADMMTMTLQRKIKIPAKSRLVFKPGSYHMMLMKPGKLYRAGDEIQITLGFADGTSVVEKFRVKKSAAPSMDHHHHGK
jgi:copper(I)-binding protein